MTRPQSQGAGTSRWGAASSAVEPLRRKAERLLAWAQSSARTQWCAVFVPVLVVYLVCLRVVFTGVGADVTAMVPAAWGIVDHGSPIVAKADWPFTNPFYLTVGTDLVISDRPPGLVYLVVPFYWLFSGADQWEVYPASLAAALVTAAAAASFGVLIRRLLGEVRGPRIGLAAAFVMAFATTTWTVSGIQLFPQGPDQLFLVLAMLAIAAGAPARAGAAFALAVVVRPTVAIAAAVMGLAHGWHRRSMWPVITVGVLTAVGLAVFWWYSHRYWNVVVHSGGAGADGGTISRGALNGTATHGYLDKLADWSLGAIGDLGYKTFGALVAPGRGLLIGSPFLLLLLPGLRRAWRAAPMWVRSAAVSGVLYQLVQLKAEIFTGGQSFWSYRYPLEMLTLCGPLLVLAWQRWTARGRRRRAWFGALVSLSVGWQAIGAFAFHGPYYPDRPWRFVNLASALSGDTAVLGWMAVVVAPAIAAVLLWRGYRPDQIAMPTKEPSP